MPQCACPHICERECDEQARCPYCWNEGKGCPVLFHGAKDLGICPDCGLDLNKLGAYADFIHYRADCPGRRVPCLPLEEIE